MSTVYLNLLENYQREKNRKIFIKNKCSNLIGLTIKTDYKSSEYYNTNNIGNMSPKGTRMLKYIKKTI